MRSPRLLITLTENDRELFDSVRGRLPLATFILNSAVKEAEFQRNKQSGSFQKQHQPGHDRRREPEFKETRLDYSNSQE